jgi:hypothetical protein
MAATGAVTGPETETKTEIGTLTCQKSEPEP